MATPVADRALLDTSVLLAATDEGRAEHQDALTVLDAWPASGTVLYTSGQVLREYLAVAGRPVAANGLGMAQAAAVANVRALCGRLSVLEEGVKVADRLLRLLDTVECSGKQIHDANLVATMLGGRDRHRRHPQRQRLRPVRRPRARARPAPVARLPAVGGRQHAAPAQRRRARPIAPEARKARISGPFVK